MFGENHVEISGACIFTRASRHLKKLGWGIQEIERCGVQDTVAQALGLYYIVRMVSELNANASFR